MVDVDENISCDANKSWLHDLHPFYEPCNEVGTTKQIYHRESKAPTIFYYFFWISQRLSQNYFKMSQDFLKMSQKFSQHICKL